MSVPGRAARTDGRGGHPRFPIHGKSLLVDFLLSPFRGSAKSSTPPQPSIRTARPFASLTRSDSHPRYILFAEGGEARRLYLANAAWVDESRY